MAMVLLPDEWNPPKYRFGEKVYTDDDPSRPGGIVGMDYGAGEEEGTWEYKVRRGNVTKHYEEEQLSRKRPEAQP